MRFRNRHLLVLDALALVLSATLAYTLRLERLPWNWAPMHQATWLAWLALCFPLRLAAFWVAGLYRRLWRLAGVADLEAILAAGLVAMVISSLAGAWVLPTAGLVPVRVPLSVLLLDALLVLGLVALPRLVWRGVALRDALVGARHPEPRGRAIVAGAGTAGSLIVRELLSNAGMDLVPVAFVDDDRDKHGKQLAGLRVAGGIDDLRRVAAEHGAGAVIIAMPTAPGTTIRRVHRLAADAKLAVRTVPGLFEIISGRVSVSHLRNVEIQDLLRREPVRTDLQAVAEYVGDRTVLVTGAGGSIGSELCRQVAALDPERLLLLGQDENAIFEIHGELRARYPDIDLHPVIANIRDASRLAGVMEEHRPHAVFHAAAHKHVPLMEANVAEAVLNNVLGTRVVVRAAAEAGVRHLVQISTDKAVRPTSVMGATKRCAELAAQLAAAGGRHFVSVRFGNVLGSNGSVVPTFLKQIREGRPITITHPEMVRYFMTIPEAVQLVLQAGALGRGGEVFVLDMGEPVRIVDLAHDLIRLSGLVPGEDVEIRFTGVRPGEKLYEEMFFDAEHATPTAHPKVLCSRRTEVPPDCAERLDELIAAAERQAPEPELRYRLQALVPDFGRVATTGDYAPVLPTPAGLVAVK